MGSTAFQKGLGAIHSLSHPVNALNNVHHGLSNAIFMPYVLSFNKDVIEEKIVKICEYLELKENLSMDLLIGHLSFKKKILIYLISSLKLLRKKILILDRLSKMALEDPIYWRKS